MNEPTVSDRGFRSFDGIPATMYNYLRGCEVPVGETVRVFESSAADGPHLWVDITDGRTSIGAHLTLENAIVLRDQLTWLIEHHYQLTDHG